MLVNLQLKESGSWICRKDGKINETFVRGAALDIELTDGIKEIAEKFSDMVEIVPIKKHFRSKEGVSNV
jgi:hypothetical protein